MARVWMRSFAWRRWMMLSLVVPANHWSCCFRANRNPEIMQEFPDWVSPQGGGRVAKVIASRMSAEMEGQFVVFLIGMRINKPWKLHKWLSVFFVMPEMLKELAAHTDAGSLA